MKASPSLRRAFCGALVSACASVSAQAQASTSQDTTTVVTVKLDDGSSIQGRVISETADSLTVVSATLGRLTFARSVVRAVESHAEAQSALAAVPNIGLSTVRRTKWTRKFEVGVQYLSEMVRDEVGAVAGISLGGSIERATPTSKITLSTQANYQRQEPNPPASDDRMVTISATRDIGPRYRLVTQTFLERNNPQEIDFRITQHLGLGRILVKSQRIKLFVAPGVTYQHANASEEAELAANGTVTASGFGVGFYESLGLQIAPSIGLSQNILWTEITGRRQTAATITLSGRVATGVSMNVVYNRRFDSGLIDPVQKTFSKLMVGLQFGR